MSKDRQSVEAESQISARKSSGKIRRYNVLIMVTIVVAFSIMTFAISKLLYDTRLEEKIQNMTRAADTILNYSRLDEQFLYIAGPSDQIRQNLEVTATLTDSIVWIVKDDGEMFYSSEIPPAARNSLVQDANGKRYLPEDIRDLELPTDGFEFTGGNFLGVFQDGSGSWLSVVKPVYNNTGRLMGSVQIHNRLSVLDASGSNILNILLFVILIALLVAVFVVRAFTAKLSRPIHLLAKAANEVAKGEYGTRIDFQDFQDTYVGVGEGEEEMLNLMRTFNRMTEQIESQHREQSDFIASISHDLRTPLTSIGGFVTAILDGTIPPDRQEKYLQVVQDETRRLSVLVSEMNDAILLDTQNSTTTNFTEFDIHELIRRVLQNLEVLIDEKAISIQVNFAQTGEEKIHVIGDEQQIERVLYNLISNAVKFVNEEGIIAISAWKKSAELLKIEIEDNGPGIDPKDRPYVFDRFFKSDRSRTNRQGSGLGLYICKRILALHGQQIFALDSQMGGAKFDFTLPLA